MKTKATKPKAQPDAEKCPRKSVQVNRGATEAETGRNYAAMLTSPALAAFRVINGVELKSGLGDRIDAPTFMEQLRDEAAAVNAGSLSQAEAMLMNQATALQSLFSRLAERGMRCDDAAPFECNMRMALRAQSQCRATLETLAAIKNPSSVAFVRQANIAAGPQQVNNGPPRLNPRGRGKSKASKSNFWGPIIMANGWTPERRAQQAAAIRRWRPWEQSTGPKSAEGKARSSMRGFKGAQRAKLRELAQLMRTEDGRDPFEVFEEMERLVDGLSPAK